MVTAPPPPRVGHWAIPCCAAWIAWPSPGDTTGCRRVGAKSVCGALPISPVSLSSTAWGSRIPVTGLDAGPDAALVGERSDETPDPAGDGGWKAVAGPAG